MQELALRGRARRGPVVAVARERMADRGEVGPDLVRAAGLEPDAHERVRARGTARPRSGCGPRGCPCASTCACARARRGRAARRSSRVRDPGGRQRAPGTRARPRAARSAAGARRGRRASPLATSIRPEVSRSRRWTASGPHRGTRPATRRACCRGGPAPGGPRAGRLVDDHEVVVLPHDRGLARRGPGPRIGLWRSTRTRSPPARRVRLRPRPAVDQHRARLDQRRRRGDVSSSSSLASHASSRVPAASAGTVRSRGAGSLKARAGREHRAYQQRHPGDDRDVGEVEGRPQRADR